MFGCILHLLFVLQPNVLDQFELSDEDLDNLTGKFHTDLIESLSKESHGSPLHVEVSSLTKQNNSYDNKTRSVVLSWTATCISIHQVVINGSDFNVQPLEKMKILPSDIKTLDNLVDKVLEYLIEAMETVDTSAVILVHDFALSDDDKLTISCINGPNCWKLEGDSNSDINSLINSSLQARVCLCVCLCVHMYNPSTV